MTKILIDTNVIIDFLANRAPFAESAEKLAYLAIQNKISAHVTANSITDIYYVLQKTLGKAQSISKIKLIDSIFSIVDITRSDIVKAIELGMPDFEDALVMQIAKHIKANYIVTRNLKDFENSQIQAISPQNFLTICGI